MNSKRKLLNASNVIVGLWLLAMFTIFPLVYNYYYYDILQTKFYTVVILTVLMILALIVISGFGGGFKTFFDKVNSKGFSAWFKEEFDIWDICVTVFMVMTVLSTLFAGQFIRQAVTGENGRYSGLSLYHCMLPYIL